MCRPKAHDRKVAHPVSHQRKARPMAAPNDTTPKPKLYSIMDDVPATPRKVSAAALLAARTGQPLPANIKPETDKDQGQI